MATSPLLALTELTPVTSTGEVGLANPLTSTTSDAPLVVPSGTDTITSTSTALPANTCRGLALPLLAAVTASRLPSDTLTPAGTVGYTWLSGPRVALPASALGALVVVNPTTRSSDGRSTPLSAASCTSNSTSTSTVLPTASSPATCRKPSALKAAMPPAPTLTPPTSTSDTAHSGLSTPDPTSTVMLKPDATLPTP